MFLLVIHVVLLPTQHLCFDMQKFYWAYAASLVHIPYGRSAAAIDHARGKGTAPSPSPPMHTSVVAQNATIGSSIPKLNYSWEQKFEHFKVTHKWGLPSLLGSFCHENPPNSKHGAPILAKYLKHIFIWLYFQHILVVWWTFGKVPKIMRFCCAMKTPDSSGFQG